MHPIDKSLIQYSPSNEPDLGSTYYISDKSIKMIKDGDSAASITGDFYEGKSLIFNYVYLPISQQVTL